ncbi:hypothetical protein ACWEKT_40365 [Nocardia takedensis]
MARTLRLLADQELVELRPDPTDKRRVLVVISTAGSARLDDERTSRAARIARTAQSKLAERERAVLRRLPAVREKLIAESRSGVRDVTGGEQSRPSTTPPRR